MRLNKLGKNIIDLFLHGTLCRFFQNLSIFPFPVRVIFLVEMSKIKSLKRDRDNEDNDMRLNKLSKNIIDLLLHGTVQIFLESVDFSVSLLVYDAQFAKPLKFVKTQRVRVRDDDNVQLNKFDKKMLHKHSANLIY